MADQLAHRHRYISATARDPIYICPCRRRLGRAFSMVLFPPAASPSGQKANRPGRTQSPCADNLTRKALPAGLGLAVASPTPSWRDGSVALGLLWPAAGPLICCQRIGRISALRIDVVLGSVAAYYLPESEHHDQPNDTYSSNDGHCYPETLWPRSGFEASEQGQVLLHNLSANWIQLAQSGAPEQSALARPS
jgi:hypothetical protein